LYLLILVLSFEYKVTGNNGLNVSLVGDAKVWTKLLLLVGKKKEEVTGAVSTVDSKTLEILKPVKVEQTLQGTVSGVVTSRAIDIRISKNGENGPTTIIDGYVGELGLLNPNDIETITVLKDAQAAIYGTIGANGYLF
jgi:TonB-dependent SusC/RagA subfamily outer membrane receptor